jgi:hypothetical protein
MAKLLSIVFLIAIAVCGLMLVDTAHFGLAQNSSNVDGVLFSDNFQSGNLSVWNGTSIDPPATCNVTNSNAFNNSAYTLHSLVPADVVYSPNAIVGDAFAYKDFDNYTNLYASCWVKWISFGDSPTLSRALKLAGPNGNYAISAVGVEDVNGTFEWALHYRDENEVYHVVANASTPLQLNIWYYVEIHGQVSSTSGLSEGWVDGEKFESVTGLNNQLIGDICQLRAGLEEGGQLASVPAENYLNNVTVSTNYISYTLYHEQTQEPSPSQFSTIIPTPIQTTIPILYVVVIVVVIASIGSVATVIVKHNGRKSKELL